MKEMNFASEIKRACDTFDCWFYKIPDSSVAQRFLIKKPFDSILIYDGFPIAIEFKMHKSTGAFPFNSVKDHQVEGLLNFESAGGKALVMVNFRREIYNRTFYIDIMDFERRRRNFCGIRKSIPLSDLLRFEWEELTRTSRDLKGNLCWDMEKLCRSIK